MVAIMVIAIGLVTGEVAQHDDWLLQGLGASAAKFAATLESVSPSEIKLQNGLVSRTFTTTIDGGLCTTGDESMVSKQTFFRAVGTPHPPHHLCQTRQHRLRAHSSSSLSVCLTHTLPHRARRFRLRRT